MKNTSYKKLDPDNCAMCGMCLNHCPTYKISRNESESPRGRISIIHGLNNSMLQPSESALKHLNSCTLCLACEAACPAKVDFYKMMIDARDKYFKDQNIKFKIKTNLISFFLKNYFLKGIASKIIFYITKHKFKYLNKNIFKFMNYIQDYNNHYEIDQTRIKKNTIGIFTGCATDFFQKEVANNCINILKKSKINYEIIKNARCCGSLDYNSGKIERGIKNNKLTVKEFNKKKYVSIIGYASGCSAFINKNNKDVNYQDATTFILDLLENKKINNYKITKKNICIHKPCTTKSAEINFEKLITVLKMIPGIKIFTYDDDYCCGAGAQNLIHNQKNLSKIIEPKISFINSNNIDCLLTYNVGCSLNFINEINIKNIKNVKVMHPITFLNDRIC